MMGVRKQAVSKEETGGAGGGEVWKIGSRGEKERKEQEGLISGSGKKDNGHEAGTRLA